MTVLKHKSNLWIKLQCERKELETKIQYMMVRDWILKSQLNPVLARVRYLIPPIYSSAGKAKLFCDIQVYLMRIHHQNIYTGLQGLRFHIESNLPYYSHKASKFCLRSL